MVFLKLFFCILYRGWGLLFWSVVFHVFIETDEMLKLHNCYDDARNMIWYIDI